MKKYLITSLVISLSLCMLGCDNRSADVALAGKLNENTSIEKEAPKTNVTSAFLDVKFRKQVLKLIYNKTYIDTEEKKNTGMDVDDEVKLLADNKKIYEEDITTFNRSIGECIPFDLREVTNISGIEYFNNSVGIDITGGDKVTNWGQLASLTSIKRVMLNKPSMTSDTITKISQCLPSGVEIEIYGE